MATFGERCKALRKDKGISQDRFAQDIGVNKGTVSKWETDVRLPEISTITMVAGYFNVSISFLMGYSNNRYEDNDSSAPVIDDDLCLEEFMKMYLSLTEDEKKIINATLKAIIRTKKDDVK